jgi:hypothetical protein
VDSETHGSARSPRLSRGSSAPGRAEYAVAALSNAVASAVKRREAFPLASPTMAPRSMRDDHGSWINESSKQEHQWLMRFDCRSPRSSRGCSASGRIEHAAEVLPDAVIGGEATGSVSPRLSNDGSKRGTRDGGG